MPTLLKYNTAEGGSDGVTVTTGNSGGTSGDAFNTVSGTSFVYSNLHPFSGALGYKFTSGVNYLAYTGLGTITNWRIECACYFTSVTGTTTIMRALDGSGNYTKLEFSGSSQVFRVGNQSTNFGTSTMSIVANTMYYVTMEGNRSTGQVVTKIYNSSMVLQETLTHSPAAFYDMAQAQFGPSLAGPNGGYYDSLYVYNAAQANHSLTASSLTSASSVGAPALSSSGSGNASLAALAIASTPVVGHPAMTQAQLLAANLMTSASSVGTPALSYLGPYVTINSIKTGQTQYGQDYARILQAPSSNGALVTLWHKPDPIADVTYPRTCGNHEVLLLGGSNWNVQNILDNMTVEANGVCSVYNQNTQFFGGAWGSETWAEDYTLYYNTAGLLTEAQVTDWKFAAWQVINDVANQRFIFRQWIKFNGGSMMKTGAQTEAGQNYDSIVTWAALRAKLVSRGWLQATADAWVPASMSFIGFGDNASGGANLPNITRCKAFDRTTEPTLSELEAISQKLIADSTAWADWPFEYSGGPVLTDRSGNGRTLSTSGTLAQGYAFSFNEPLVTTLAANSLTASPAVGHPAASQSSALTANGLTASPIVGNPAAGSSATLTASSLTSASAVGQPALSGVHVLTSSGLSSAPAVGQPALSQIINGTFAAVGLTATTAVGSPELTGDHALNASGLLSAPVVGNPGAEQAGIQGATSITAEAFVGRPTLYSGVILAPVLHQGAWKAPAAGFVAVSGQWRQAVKVYAVKNGAWIQGG